MEEPFPILLAQLREKENLGLGFGALVFVDGRATEIPSPVRDPGRLAGRQTLEDLVDEILSVRGLDIELRDQPLHGRFIDLDDLFPNLLGPFRSTHGLPSRRARPPPFLKGEPGQEFEKLRSRSTHRRRGHGRSHVVLYLKGHLDPPKRERTETNSASSSAEHPSCRLPRNPMKTLYP